LFFKKKNNVNHGAIVKWPFVKKIKMYLYKRILICLVLLNTITAFAQAGSAKEKMGQLIKENFLLADTQYRYMMTLVPANRMPQSYDEKNKKFLSNDIQWWCSGFYTGCLWYIFEQTSNGDIKKEAERALAVLEPNQNFTGNHDLGFMMFCSFGNACRVTKNEKYKQIIFRSAQSLATRYRPSIHAIQSWDSGARFKCPVIIDNMMNLEILAWVSENGGDARFKKMAITHANTTMKNHFRKDFSSYHVLDYNLSTGKVLKKVTWQGAADCSAWARGQAWGFYGYTMMYRFTKNKKYLTLARNIAKFIIRHPNLPADKIPYWDFNAALIPGAKRDASAGALFASALLELAQYAQGTEKDEYISNAEAIITALSTDVYRAKAGENGGFLLKHCTGALPQNAEIDVPLIYADYYFLEALKRYKDWYL
jgi:unsaturated chondroitin disaccharide hydrolase